MSQIPDFIAGTAYIYAFGACHKFQISLQELFTFIHLVHVTNVRVEEVKLEYILISNFSVNLLLISLNT